MSLAVPRKLRDYKIDGRNLFDIIKDYFYKFGGEVRISAKNRAWFRRSARSEQPCGRPECGITLAINIARLVLTIKISQTLSAYLHNQLF